LGASNSAKSLKTFVEGKRMKLKWKEKHQCRTSIESWRESPEFLKGISTLCFAGVTYLKEVTQKLNIKSFDKDTAVIISVGKQKCQ
jgi:hypothetical protein